MNNREFVSKVTSLVKAQQDWRHNCLPVHCSENVMSPTVREMLSSDFQHRYANVHGSQVFIGNELMENADELSIDVAKKLFGAGQVDLHSPSASIACKAPIVALTRENDIVMELEPRCGGFASLNQMQATPTLASGLHSEGLPFNFDEMNIDVDSAVKKIRAESPKMVVLGATVFLFPHPISEIAEAANETGTIVIYDAAQVFGLVAGKKFQQPFAEGAEIITGSTHKTLPGPQGGIILIKDNPEYAEKISKTLHESFIGVGHPSMRAAQAILFAEMIEFGEKYADQVIRSSKALAEALHERGFDVICENNGFTRSHMVVVNVSKLGGAHFVAKILDKANIEVTKSGIPGVDDLSDGLYSGNISGIRLGTEEAVRLGMGPSEMNQVADFLARALLRKEDASKISQDIAEFRKEFQKIHFSFDDGCDPYKYCTAH